MLVQNSFLFPTNIGGNFAILEKLIAHEVYRLLTTLLT